MTDRPSVCTGDRALYEGIGQLRGKQVDVVSVFGRFASARFDSGQRVLCLATDLYPVPRRPRPDF